MEISVTAWEKYKPQGTAGILYPPNANYTRPTRGSGVRREEGYGAALRVQPALQDDGGGKLVEFMTADVAVCWIITGSLERGMSFGGGEALVPEVDGEGWLVRGLCNERLELFDEEMDAPGLAAGISGEVQRVSDDNAGAAMAAGEAEDGALVAAGLRALEGKQRLRDAQGIGERDADAAGADVEAEPGLRGAEPGLGLTGKWHIRHALMIARGDRLAD
jgi:hypothetical protein